MWWWTIKKYLHVIFLSNNQIANKQLKNCIQVLFFEYCLQVAIHLSYKYIACLSCRLESSKAYAKSSAEVTVDYASFETSLNEPARFNSTLYPVTEGETLQGWFWLLIKPIS